MKTALKSLLAGMFLVASTAQAHQFWPDSYTVYATPGRDALVITHLRSEDTEYFSFTLNGHELGSGAQIVFGDQTTDFPITVPASMVKNNEVLICSTKESADTMKQEVCLRIKFE